MIDALLLSPFDGLWPRVEVDVVKISTSTGNPKKEIIYSSLPAARSQKEVKEVVGPFQEVASKIVDVFYISQVDGELPAILEEHFIRLDGVDRQILSVTDQGGQGATLEVITERAR